jgi:hypothetical protein
MPKGLVMTLSIDRRCTDVVGCSLPETAPARRRHGSFRGAGVRFQGLAAIISAVALALPAAAQSTAFTYQGELKQNGQLGSGAFDMQFRLYDAASGGSQVGATLCTDNVQVEGGRFTTEIDFGQQYSSTAARFLEIAVRPDTGLNCSSSAGFTLLSRQPLTATPFASHAHGAFRLDRPNGNGAVFVDASGRVGIGTAAPARELTVAGNMEMGTSHGDYRNFRIGGGNSSGFLYGSFPAYADGIHMGYNYFADNAGVHRIIQPGGATSRITTGYGFVALATGGVNATPVNRIVVDSSGNTSMSGNVTVAGNLTTGPIVRFKSIHGSSFLPDVISRDMGGFALVDHTGVTGYGPNSLFVAAVELPHGAVVTEFRVYAIDERSIDFTITLGRTDMNTGGTAAMASVTTSGNSSAVQNLANSNIVWSTVLNDNHAYWITANMNSYGGARHKIIGVRIRYTVTQPQP